MTDGAVGLQDDSWCFTVIEADERRIISVKAELVRRSLPVQHSEGNEDNRDVRDTA